MKKVSLKKRILSIVLAAFMLLSYIPGAVWAVDAGTDIKAIQKPTGISIVEDYDDYVGDNWLSSLELPTSVTVTLADDTTVDVPVTWDASSLDTRTTGYYSLPGTVVLPEGATNGNDLEVSITIQVREYKNLISNPSFEDGTTNWKLRGLKPYIATDYPKSGNNALMFGSSAGGFDFWNEDQTALAERVALYGAGQYYFAVNVRQIPNAEANVTNFYVNVNYKDANTNSFALAENGTGTKITVSKDGYLKSEGICTLGVGLTHVRLRAYASKNVSTTWETTGIRFDDVELVPLKFPLAVEPSAVQEIKTELLSRKVAVNYPDYINGDWKAALNLPKTVEVLTDAGDTAEVAVKWSYAGLDLTNYGKYTLTGTLDDSSFPNPKGLTVQQNIYVTRMENIVPNGDFEKGTNSWKASWVRSVVKDPLNAANQVYLATKSQMVTSAGGSMVTYQADDAAIQELVTAFATAGAGQYVYSVDAMSAPYDSTTPARQDVELWLKLTANTTGSASGNYGIATTEKGMLSDTQWTTISTLVDMDASLNWLRTDVFCKAGASESGAVYLDNVQLLPVNVEIPKGHEPADVDEIVEELPIRAVIQNYDKYAGEFWQTALGLPTSVQVRTANGITASVGVTWDYSNLDLTKTGKYILTGTLDTSTYPNPLNLVVRQTIYIRDYMNLLENPSFEDGIANWSAGSGSSTKDTVNRQHGASSLQVTTSANLANSLHVQVAYVNSSDQQAQKDLGAKIAYQGAGQYYFSGWAKTAGASAEGLNLRVELNYKLSPELSSISRGSENVPLSSTQWVQAAQIMEIPADIQWARFDMFLAGDTRGVIAKQTVCLDNAEVVPLNVIVETYEGAMEEVESIIPDRQIIQNYPDYIGEGYSTKDLMLPETVDVRSTTGEVIKIEVKWDYSLLDLSKTGTYTLYGRLEDMRLANPDGLTVKQTVKVVSKMNLFSNGSFENDDKGWKYHNRVKLGVGNSSPVRTGDYSLKYDTDRMDTWSLNYLQSFWNDAPTNVSQRIVESGAGKYYFGGWMQGTASTNDITVELRMLYKQLSSGDTTTTTRTPKVTLSTSSFTQVGDIVEMPDDIWWARMDFYLYGTPEQMRLSTLYLDDFELIPLNVEIPNLTDIIDCEDVVDIYVHEGSTVKDLKLPESLQVIIKTGQKFNLDVIWDTSTFDPNLVGEQTITGSLKLGNTYKNPKNFTPTARIIIRAKGEPLRQTIYISTSGSEDNDGLSPNSPKQDIKKIATYLQQGYHVKLKRGDTWYLPTGSLSLKNIYGTEDAPITLGAYGSGELPTIAYMLKIENSAWKLVDEARNIYAADVSALGQYNGIPVYRCFVGDEAYTFKDRTNYKTLKEGQYCSYDSTLYIRMPEGQLPKDVEANPYGGGHRVVIDHASNFTIEYVHLKGGGGIQSFIYIETPTANLKWSYCSITHVNYYVMMWEADDDEIHYRPEISNCYMDANFSEEEGAVNEGHWAVSLTEGITMRDGVDGAWLHHNHIRNMSHAFIAIESTDKSGDYTTTGVRNCIIEDNLLEGANALYARAFNICGGFNLAGIQMCRDNIFRRNKCYDMTTSSHLYGENNLVYSNLFSYVHCEYDEDGNLFDGKTAQPWGFDTIPWGDHTSVGDMLINNTFYNVSGAIAIYDQAHTVHDNIYANNLIVNFTSDQSSYPGGALYDNTIDMQYVMNNGIYSTEDLKDHFVVDKVIYSADDVNDAVAGYSGNIYADPGFLDADLTQMDKGARLDFTLGSESPMRYAGLSLYADVYKSFPAWEKLKAEYTDINGVVYLAESPSIGAYSYCEKIKGDVAEVGKLEDIVARPGATFDQLNLPDAVPATNDQGIEVMLLPTWSDANFDSSKPGTITLTAQLRNGPHTELNINGKTASINVVIKDKLELLNITTVLKDLTVLYGTSLEEVIKQLPAVLDVQEESGYQEKLPVTWSCEDYDPEKPGAYVFECILPEDMITNAREFDVRVEVRVLHEIGRGTELLINPDFTDGTSAAPWKFGWGTGSIKVTTDPQYVYPGEDSAVIVTAANRWGSLQQDVTGQVQLMGDGKYLFKCYMRTFDSARPVESSYACFQLLGPTTVTHRARVKTNIGVDWVEFSMIMDVENVDQATQIMFHTSTGKTEENVKDKPISFIISGCSLVYLGNTDAEVEATMDSLDLVWSSIKGDNESEKNVMSDLTLPVMTGTASKITWSSSDETAITNDGKVTMGRVPKTVKLTATITYSNGIETVKRFTLTVPRDPSLPAYSASISGDQTVKAGDEFHVKISLDSTNASAFNVYRFTLSFNTSKLEYVGISDPASTVSVDGGKLVIYGIGAERPISDTFTVTFRAKKSGITEIKLTSVEMDLDPNADLELLPAMTVTNGTATIDVQKGEAGDEDVSGTAEKDNSVVIWIIIGLAAAALIAGGAIVLILVKKKKQTPPETEKQI